MFKNLLSDKELRLTAFSVQAQSKKSFRMNNYETKWVTPLPAGHA